MWSSNLAVLSLALALMQCPDDHLANDKQLGDVQGALKCGMSLPDVRSVLAKYGFAELVESNRPFGTHYATRGNTKLWIGVDGRGRLILVMWVREGFKRATTYPQ